MYQFLASLTLILHFTFILFVIFGGLLFFVKRWAVYFHIPALCYGAYVEFAQSICPLTNVENYFLLKAEDRRIPRRRYRWARRLHQLTLSSARPRSSQPTRPDDRLAHCDRHHRRDAPPWQVVAVAPPPHRRHRRLVRAIHGPA